MSPETLQRRASSLQSLQKSHIVNGISMDLISSNNSKSKPPDQKGRNLIRLLVPDTEQSKHNTTAAAATRVQTASQCKIGTEIPRHTDPTSLLQYGATSLAISQSESIRRRYLCHRTNNPLHLKVPQFRGHLSDQKLLLQYGKTEHAVSNQNLVPRFQKQ